MCASAATAAPQPAFLPTGSVALPPVGFVDFCTRQPQDCGDDASQVLEGAARARAERQALLSLALHVAPASVGRPGPVAPTLLPVDAPLSALVEAADAPGPVAFIDPAARGKATPPAIARLDRRLWATLNRVNASVNAAIESRTDAEALGEEDVWSTPIAEGRPVGDCEDYVLEKRRALIAAGVSPRALNIAVVVTSWGETHAVLLVATHKGEFVLDNLSSWVTPWGEAPYRWRQRQVNGEAFTWAMAAPDRDAASPRKGRLLLAAAR